MQTAESKQKTASIRVSEWLVNELKDRQHDQRKAGKPEPSYVELLDEAWTALNKASSEKHDEPLRVKAAEGEMVHIEVCERDVPIYQALHKLLQIPNRGPAVTTILNMLLKLIEDPE